MLKHSPSLEEYAKFHGMLCSPRTAQRCIESFDGISLVMPNTYSSFSTNIATYDVTPPILTTFSYYMLVIATFTGLSTLLNVTKMHCAEEYYDPPVVVSSIASISDTELVADESVWRYIKEDEPKTMSSQTDDLKLQKKFEFEFLGGLLSVVMLHLKCHQNRLHLVEVYQIKNKLLHRFAVWLTETWYVLSRPITMTPLESLKKRKKQS